MNPESSTQSLVYGEIDFFSFATILEKAKPRKNDIFCDLGHGTGRAVIAAVSYTLNTCTCELTAFAMPKVFNMSGGKRQMHYTLGESIEDSSSKMLPRLCCTDIPFRNVLVLKF